MAGFNFEGGKLPEGVVNPDDISPEQLKTALKGLTKRGKKARLRLENFLRDFERTTQQKQLAFESQVAGVRKQGIVRGDTPEEVDRIIEEVKEKQLNVLEARKIQFEKDLDRITTRLKTQDGLEKDFDKVSDLDEALQGNVEAIQEDLLGAIEKLRERSKEAIKDKEEKKRRKEVFEEAQRAGEERQEQVLEKRKGEFEFTPTEIVKATIDRFFFMGRRGSLFTDSRQKRRSDVVKGALSEGEEEFRERVRQGGLDPDDPNSPQFKSRKTPAGFRFSDLAVPLTKLAAAVTTFKVIDRVVEKGIESTGKTIEGFATGEGGPQASSLFKTLSLSQLPLNVSGKVLTQILRSSEKIGLLIEKDIRSFSGEALSANIERQIALIESNIERADKFGEEVAFISRERTKLDLEVRKISDKIYQWAFPPLAGLNLTLNNIAKFINDRIPEPQDAFKVGIPKGLEKYFEGPQGKIVLGILKNLANKFNDVQDPDYNIIEDFNAFMRNEDRGPNKQNTNLPDFVRNRRRDVIR